MNQPRLLYIAGPGRSGSTVLHNILGQIDGFAAMGELRYLWERRLLDGALCGCGAKLLECSTWQAIFEDAFSDSERLSDEMLVEITERFRIHHLPLSVIPPVWRRRLRSNAQYLATLSSLYSAIGRVTNARVIVDSSKNPAYGHVLAHALPFEMHIVHLTRDSRGVAYSWAKKKLFQPATDSAPPNYMAQKTPARSAVGWDARNAATEIFLRRRAKTYTRVRYEDFLDRPRQTIEEIVAAVGETQARLDFIDQERVRIERVCHSVHGNAVRFSTGELELRSDDEWKHKSRARDKATATLLSWPLLARYQYRLRP